MSKNKNFTRKEQLYPYLETTNDDLQGEVWKDVLDYEGSYQVSSFGRVKSLDRIVPHPKIHAQFVKGRMLVPKVMKTRNIKTGEPMISLQVSLCKDGKSHFFNIRRLVYQAFVNPLLSYQADGLYVINLDCDGYNNRVENLSAVSKQIKSRRIFDRGRIDSYLKGADRSQWTKNGGSSQRKPIDQFNLQGELIASYLSVTEATAKTGIDDKTIIGVAKGRSQHHKGFVFKYRQSEN